MGEVNFKNSKELRINFFHIRLNYVLKFLFISAFVFLKTIDTTAQFQEPYLVKNKNAEESNDSLWVLFQDIKRAETAVIIPMSVWGNPTGLKVNDVIRLDSGYKLELVITQILWKDSLDGIITGFIPSKKNVPVKLRFWWFGFENGNWIVEGQTQVKPEFCHQLIFKMQTNKSMILEVTDSNCD